MPDTLESKGIFSSRGFEHQISPYFKATRELKKETARKFYYEVLFEISIKHDFYNGNDNECLDFIVCPTAASTILMRNLGLLFKQKKTGCSILYNKESEKKLFDFLREHGIEKNNQLEYWTLLSFVTVLKSPDFVNYTKIYFDTNISKNNFYLTNQQAHFLDNQTDVVLNKDEYISQRTQDYFNIVPTQYHIQFGHANKIKVFDVAEEVVLCLPNKIPVGLPELKRWSNINCACVEQYIKDNPHAKCISRDSIYINFSDLPEGLYVIKWMNENDDVLEQQNVIYSLSGSTPLCFINLLFSQPKESFNNEVGIYPVCLKSEKIKSINYQLKFEQRCTHWIYWIIGKSSLIKNLRIESDYFNDEQFEGPYSGELSNGQKAHWFISKKPMPLQQIPTFRFKLIGQQNFDSERVLVDPLPLASKDQVLNKRFCNVSDEQLTLLSSIEKYSEIYVYV